MKKTIFTKLNGVLSTTTSNLNNLNVNAAPVAAAAMTAIKPSASANSNVLQDLFGRTHTYLRVSLTERCNLRCTYCMPEEGVKLTQNEKLLSAREIVRLVDYFVKLGVNKVRFTGGEPLVRKDCVDIIRDVSKLDGLKKIAITTNGLVLSRKLDELKSAGLNQINISLDTLEEKKFEFIAKRKGWSRVMESIDKSLNAGFLPLKINCVVMKGINDDEICNFIEMTKDKNVDVRFIEYMPFDGNKWNTKKMVSFREMLKIIAQKYPLESINRLQDDPNDTSKAFKISNYKGQFGFITSMSEHFCNTCNRIRLTADGNLKVCLFGNSEVSLRDAIRSNVTDDQLSELISAAIKRKKAKHADERLSALNFTHNKPLNRTSSFQKPDYLHLYSNLTHRPRFTQNVQRRFYSKGDFSSSGGDKNPNEVEFESEQRFWTEFAKHHRDSDVNRAGFTHLDEQTSLPKQVDISGKEAPADEKPVRVACASGYIQLDEATYRALSEDRLKKGNALIVAQLAGIQASKQTSNLIPLCHQILLDVCEVKFTLDDAKHQVRCQAVCKTSVSKTGVEMEALTACSIALLTIYDMCKALQKDATLNDIKLEYKYGGKSDFKRDSQ